MPDNPLIKAKARTFPPGNDHTLCVCCFVMFVSRRKDMLVLTRTLSESIVIDGAVRVTVLGVKGNKVRIGVTAPDWIRIDRQEVAERRSFDTPDLGDASDARALFAGRGI
jgi:carbon storage regulator